ncbi:probable 39S ribosomal protein L49, mitochondrial [Lutzomyia longipalpis]|uniref:probable 39S ribosomal protein L49, mitochondrial n=1 Tax=Lutzomyia longipalpis TaxID=7200 RepID=UPI00248365E1|nr:probable 39S ribosomal protein L49, mitochondrial [Lutzomyia longipalpis]
MANSVCLSKLKILHEFSARLKSPGGADVMLRHLKYNGMIGYGAGSQVRHSSFRSSPQFGHIDDHPPVEIAKNPPEWKFVERLLGPATVPAPKAQAHYPSGWRPQQIDAAQRDYFIARTRNHMIPVYLESKFRGSKKVTVVRKIEGDIWKLEEELRGVIEKAAGRKIISRINEMSGQIEFTGAYVNIITEYLMDKGY